jgi:hypothetical protein
MLLKPRWPDALRGNGGKAYKCSGCHRVITHSDKLLQISGKIKHSFVNPAGVECDFYTFSTCPGAVAVGSGTTLHSWFVGYAWRMGFCGECGRHLGWYYEGVSESARPHNFWGVLLSGLIAE